MTLIAAVPARSRRSALLIHAGAYLTCGFLTRLTFEGVESRVQILGFACAAAIFEPPLSRMKPAGRSNVTFGLTAALAAALGVALARPIAHRASNCRLTTVERA